MVKRPSIWILCFFMIGIVCNKYICAFSGFIPIILVTAILCVFFYSILKHKYSVSSDYFLFLLPVILCLGYFLPTYYDKNNNLSDDFIGKQVNYQGKVDHVIQKSAFQEIYLSDVVIIQKEKQAFLKQLLLQDLSEKEYVKGDKITGKGKVSEFEKATNPGQFGRKEFYHAQGIRYLIWDGKILRKIPGKLSIYSWLFQLKGRMSHVYEKVLPAQDSEIIHAMVLGDKSELGTELKTLYQRAGISHILAISGLHISMIGLLLFRLLKKAGFHHNLASVLCMLLIYLYGVMTGFSVSTSRAVVMMCLSLSACLVSRSYDSKSAVSVSGFFILLQQPYQLFQCSFQLSFLAVAGVLWFYPACVEYLKKLFPDFEQKIRMKEQSEFYSIGVFVNKITKVFRNSLLASCFIQMATLPALLWHYYEFASLAPVLNLFILPLSSLLIGLAVLAGVLGIFSLPLACFFSGGIHYILLIYHLLCEWFQKIPFQTVITGRPKTGQILFYTILLAGFVWIIKKRPGKWNVLFLPMALLVLCIRIPESDLQITMMDVGQGDSIFFEERCGTSFLVDAGSNSEKHVGTYLVIPFLKYCGVKKLNYCMLTHLDDDHINGVQELIEMSLEPGSVQIETLVLPRIKMVDNAYQNMVRQARKAGIRVVQMERGQQITAGRLQLKCLHPSFDSKGEDRNTLSLVLDLSYHSFHMLLTGDVTETGEQEILSLQEGLRESYDVLKVAHHGSKYSSCETWLEKVKPVGAWISCGKGNRYGHPHKELIDRLAKRKVKIYRTDLQGAVTLRIRKGRCRMFPYLKPI